MLINLVIGGYMGVFQNFIKKLFRLKSTAGNIAVSFAIAAPVLFGAIGLSVDYVSISRKQVALQAIADAAAVASAHELPIANSNPSIVVSSAKSFVKANLKLNNTAQASGANSVVSTDVKVVDKFTGVEVTLKEVWTPFFAHLLTDKATPITAFARANIVGEGLICVVGLMEKKLAGIHLDHKAKLSANGCGVYSNSKAFLSIRLDGKATIDAHSVCTMGGYVIFGSGKITPKPLTDCPKANDPLAKRPGPSYVGCDYNNVKLGDVAAPARIESVAEYAFYASFGVSPAALPKPVSNVRIKKTLLPGVYCGGLEIGKGYDIMLSPGIYIIKDGPLRVTSDATFKGVGVGFFLTGADSTFEFQQYTSISLEAPVAGDMAGLLMYEDRNVPYSLDFNPLKIDKLPPIVRMHRIQSDDARKLLGTIYLPRSILMIDGEGKVADQSAYTAIIAGRVWLRKGPNLVLNADYKSTNVPVPANLLGSQIVLSE